MSLDNYFCRKRLNVSEVEKISLILRHFTSFLISADAVPRVDLEKTLASKI